MPGPIHPRNEIGSVSNPLFFTSVLLSAQTLILTGNDATCDASRYVNYSVDPNSTKRVEEIKSKTTRWQSFKNGQTPNMGIRKETVWFKFIMQNNSERNEWILHVDYRTLDNVSL